MTKTFLEHGHTLRRPFIAATTIFMDPVFTAIFTGLANRVLARYQADFLQIEGRRIVVEASDLGKSLRLVIRQGRIAPTRAGPVDLRIAGNAKDLCRLALRLEDPDTLFFARRLILEGETSVGLQLKNILDSIELDWLAPVGYLPAPLGPRIRQTIDHAIRNTHADRRLHDLLDRALQP
ncbi:ubiquinone anaerobic biosynthesis accessory factor UbiT [Acidithiobacillus ferrooxidans]|uniref:ubiquinone anaerobic biosynthesis accessory factor UbiT n=1 Tax=Acidithiobacillus ferrooxidans TaxID=920 RepID=UPI001D01735E|nr:SCP2 sterol-binding domain-containing protein [Acidithiobacillus ferrooxidans]